MDDISDDDIQLWIDSTFEDNYEQLQLDGGHRLSRDIKKTALLQVKAYYKKMKHIAQNVTDVEIKLTLSNQRTGNNRRFSIEGVVDLINEGDEINMYDIKTHDADVVLANTISYQDQLNIYRHIWEGINEKKLNNTMIISTGLPENLLSALRNPISPDFLRRQIESWQPIVNIDTNQSDIDQTIRDLASVVDKIEDGRFSPPELCDLEKIVEGTKRSFASGICRNCDVRYSCSSYRFYAQKSSGQKEHNIIKFYNNDYINDEKDEFIEENLENLENN